MGRRDKPRRNPRREKTATKRAPAAKASCPCCNKQREVDGLGTYAEAATHGWVVWACARCLETGAAITGNPARQLSGMGLPYLAYWDRERHCSDCDRDFVFRATEQRYWYETLGFVHDSKPNQCPPCRRNRRRTRNANTAVSAALEAVDLTSADSVGEVGLVYAEAGHVKKAAEWLRRARNLARTKREKARWSRAVDAVDMGSDPS